MSYTSLPKLVPIGSPRITSDDRTKTIITDVLQSEPVKRLLNQPNIVLKAISLTPSNQTLMHSSISNSNGHPNVINCKDKPDDSVTLSNSHLDDEANFLPSKSYGKSEIALLPIKRVRKQCGHYEQCENIICDVNFQQYVDYEGSSPILAFNIDESEINAPVSKHCGNLNCDALSIDHDRCRRAVIRLCRCDKTNICDVCGISLKTRKSRLNHKNCKRKNIYRHNDVDSAQILRERMRVRELQMLAALRMKKKDYSDPLTADDNAIEALKKNSELIVIPKTTTKLPTIQPPSIPTAKTFSNQNNQKYNAISSKIVLSNKVIPVVPKSQNNTIPSRGDQYQKQHPDTQNHRQQQLNKKSSSKLSKIESMNAGNVKSIDNQFIITGVPQATISYPLSMNDWVMAHSTGKPILPAQKPYLMPVRVVPIANLKSEPSLLHQTQGIPKFCIIADNSTSPQSYINLQTISALPIHNIQTVSPTASPMPIPITGSIVSATAAATTPPVEMTSQTPTEIDANVKDGEKRIESSAPSTLKSTRSRGHYGNRNKKRVEKKLFVCTYCSKRFLTEWYFKMHIARHIGEVKATCEICEKTFTHHYDLKRHINIEHKGKTKSLLKNDNDIVILEREGRVTEKGKMNIPIMCHNCGNVFDSNVDMKKHRCKKVPSNETINGGIVIIDSVKSIGNESVKRGNGIVRGKIGDTLSTIKLRRIARSQKRIVRKRVRKRKNKNKKRLNPVSGEVSRVDCTLKC